jgi:hypothetical protein
MARFYGEVGYGTTVEQPAGSGVWVDDITERPYYGDIVRNTRQLREADKINDDIFVNNSISIVADPYAYENIFAMRYVRWMGTLWIISNVDVERPRILLTLGGVYNGPSVGASGDSEGNSGE